MTLKSIRSAALLVVILGLSVSSSGRSDSTSDRGRDRDFYLLTVGQGANVEERYGHTVLRVTGPVSHNLNWGTFDFNKPTFLLDFFVGKLDYFLSDTSRTYAMLKQYEIMGRRVVANQINLTPRQKDHLYRLVQENLRPQNRTFSYHFFFQNCATIPRDHLDKVLGGHLSRQYKTASTGASFRDYVRTGLSRPWWAGFFLEVVMNSTIDYEITVWEEMFSPIVLHEELLKQPAIDDDGLPVSGTSLLGPETVLVPGRPFPNQKWDLHPIVGLAFAALFIGMFLSVSPRIFRIAGSLALVIWGLVCGFVATVMMVAWMFSDHEVLQHNANLWIWWPTDFVYAWVGLKNLFSHGNPKPLSKQTFRVFRQYCVLHLLSALVVLTLWSNHVIAQDLSQTLFLAAPVLCLNISYLLIRYNRPGMLRSPAGS